jgi:hypothetical protein
MLPTIPPQSEQTKSADPLAAAMVSSSEDKYALLSEESEHFCEEEVQFESSRRL